MTEPFTLGVDIGGTNIKWVRVLGSGEIAASGTMRTPDDGPITVIEDIVESVAAAGAGWPQRVGAAVPGHVDTTSGHTLLVPNVGGDWNGFAFGPELARAFGVSATVINDARAFGIAELALGAAAGRERAVFATIGTGIGGAIALDGTILRNATDGIGEVGHSTVVRDGDLCGCGNRGCAEAYAGARAMVRRYSAASQRSEQGESGPDGAERVNPDTHTSMRLLRQHFDRGEPTARSVVDMATWALASAMTNLCVSLGITTAVIGGGLARRWPEFHSEISRQLALRSNLIGPAHVAIAELGDNAGAIGAALSASFH